MEENTVLLDKIKSPLSYNDSNGLTGMLRVRMPTHTLALCWDLFSLIVFSEQLSSCYGLDRIQW